MTLIDLSVGLFHQPAHEPIKPSIAYSTHEEGAAWMGGVFGVTPGDLVWSGGLGPAAEEVTSTTHAGTHVDAPWHYGPTSEGKPARTIDELPVEWFYSDGVRLDLRAKRPGEPIETADLEAALDAIGYELKPLDIVLLWTGTDERLFSEEYFEQPGMTRKSTFWLCDRGVKVIGIDAYTFDRSFASMAEDFRRTGDGRVIWEAHFAGLEREYCQIEKLANLGQLPRPFDFKVACFPIKVHRASAGWCRPVAIV